MKLTNKNWLLALAIGATVPMALPAQAGVLGLSEQEEIRAGQQVAAQAEKQYGGALPYNHPMARRVRALGTQFARLSTRKNIPYTYKVLNNDKVLNAFAAPGGPIYVTRKLVTTASNDAELAYVLGHETAHIERRHIVKQVEKQQKAGLLVGILGAVIGRGKSSNTIGAIANVGWAVVSSGYSRKDENESDAVGVRWMSQLGFDPRAAVTMLGKLGEGGRGPDFLASHPDPKSRQNSVRTLITKENLLDVARRHGGPRLASGTNYGSSAYSNTSYPDSTSPDAGNPNTDDNDQAYYPPTDDGTPASYPPTDGDDSTDNGYGTEEIDFGQPLRTRAVTRDTAVVMAPVNGFARWAGAGVSTNGLVTTLRRGSSVLQLRRNSTIAYVNNRSVNMSAPPVLYNGVLYAPLGQLAQSVGARATLDEGERAVRLSLTGRQSGFVRLP